MLLNVVAKVGQVGVGGCGWLFWGGKGRDVVMVGCSGEGGSVASVEVVLWVEEEEELELWVGEDGVVL